MACKCTQTTINATGGGAITSPLSACTYPLWINHVSGCTGSALDVHFGNPGANFLFNVGQYDYSEVGYATNNIGINVPNPIHTVSIGGTIDVEDYLHMGDNVSSGDTPFSVYLGYNAGKTAKNNKNSSHNTVIGNQALGSGGILNGANHNIAMGYGTLTNITSGEYNTVIGGGGGSNLTSQSGNVYLGYGQGFLETTESNTLRIGNQLQTPGRTTRPLIQGDFATSAATIFGSARITSLPKGDEGYVTIDKDGFLHQSKFTSGPQILKPIGINNTGIWTANTTDAAGQPWDTSSSLPGYRSVSISGGTNSTNTQTDWTGTRVGIGTDKPEVQLHIKAPFGRFYSESTNESSYIASITSGSIAYLGMAAGGGATSGSTTWRTKSFTSPLSLGGEGFIGTGFSIMRVSREVASDSGTQNVVNPFAILGDTDYLDAALVLRGDTNLGGLGGNKGIGIFTAKPTKELTVVGSISGTGAIHSTDYIKFPNVASSTYIGYGTSSGSTSDEHNTIVGYDGAGGSMAGADGNTGVGSNVLKSLTTADLNTIMGSRSGEAITTGGGNTIVGGNAGMSVSTGTGNVFLGYGQGFASNESNYLRIGNYLDNLKKSLILGNFTTSAMTINGSLELEGTLTGLGDGNTGGNEYVGVDGGVRATGTIQSPNLKFTDSNEFTSIGMNQFDGSIDSGTTNSIGNTFVGYAINNENTLNVSNFNTAVGSRSMQYIGAGALGNTAVGHKSLYSNETGDENTSIGSTSLRDNETGGYNIGIGSFALGGSVNASNNLAVGNYAMASLGLTGEFNIAIGDFTNGAISTGNNNVNVGRLSHQQVTTGSFNTSIGDQAGLKNQTGVHNVALGHKSSHGVTNQSHSHNTSIGSGSLSGITTGGCNVTVGNNTGVGIQGGGASTITTGSKNIVIGCEVDVKRGDDSNQINIGGTFFGGLGTGGNTVITHAPLLPIKTHDVYADGDIIIKPTVGLILSASTLGTTIEGPIRTKDPLAFSNTVIGEMAVKYDTKTLNTQYNTIVGYQSMSNPAFVGATYNTSLGYRTLSGTTNSRYNVAVGGMAQINNTTGSFNAAVGAGSLGFNQSGSYNVAVGGDALKGAITQSNSQNTAVGYEAGLSVTSGQLNTLLGYRSGRNLTTGTENICIGHSTNPVDVEGTRQINIGNIIWGRDVANTGAINSIGIGTTTPGAPGNSPAIPFTVNGAMSATTRLYIGDATAANNNWIDGTQGGSGNDLYINGGNDVEIIANDDITLEATGRVEFTEKGAAEPSMAIDLNDVSGQAFIENYAGNEVIGINASTRRLYFLWQGGIPAANQNWISGEENGGADLTLGSNNDIVMSATSVGIGTTSPVTKLDVHHDPTGLSNDTGGGEVVTFGSAGADYASGVLVQLRGASNWVKADADDTTQQGSLLGIALGAAPSNGILLKGFYKINIADDVTTWTPGGLLYVSTADGKITESTGSMSSGDYVRVVGYMTTTTNVIYFNPESTFIVIT